MTFCLGHSCHTSCPALALLLALLALTAYVEGVQGYEASSASGPATARLLSAGRQRGASFRHGTLRTSRVVPDSGVSTGAQAAAASSAGPADATVWVLGLDPEDQQSVDATLTSLGGSVLRVLPGNGKEADDDYHWMVKANEAAIRQLLLQHEDLTVARLPDEMKVSQMVAWAASSNSAQPGEAVTLLVSLPETTQQEVSAAVEAAQERLAVLLGPECQLAVAPLPRLQSYSITVCRKRVRAAAAWAARQLGVTWVSVQPRMKLHSLYGAAAIQDNAKLAQGIKQNGGKVPPDVLKGASSGYLPIWKAGLTGKGQVVAVFDTGIDTDSCFFFDPKVPVLTKGHVFKVPVTYSSKRIQATVYSNPTHRKVVQLTKVSDAIDYNGHGTHTSGIVAGSALGSDPLKNPALATGIAPDAKLAVVDVSKDKRSMVMDGWTFSNVPQIYDIVRKAGARITSSSLGWMNFDSDTGRPEYYKSIDEFCYQWDAYTWKSPDMLHVCSAGNEGYDDGYEYVEAPAICKNTIAVTATDGWWHLQDTDTQFNLLGSNKKLRLPPRWNYWRTLGFNNDNAYVASDNMALYVPFKSGLTLKGETDPNPWPRIKPDIAAPGLLLSAWTDSKITGKMDQCRVRMDYGTSMATPVVSGAAAIVRQYFKDGFYPTGAARKSDALDPSGTLIKAVLLAGAAAMKGISLLTYEDLTPPPSPFQGYGRVDLSASLPLASDPSWRMHMLEWKFTTVKESKTFTVKTGSNGAMRPLVVVLTWYDWPSAENTGGLLLVNDLDLVVKDSKGKAYPINGKNGRDSRNTVEKVVIPAVPSGQTFTITVTTGKPLFIKALPQQFAVAVLGPLAAPSRGLLEQHMVSAEQQV